MLKNNHPTIDVAPRATTNLFADFPFLVKLNSCILKNSANEVKVNPSATRKKDKSKTPQA